MTQLSQIPSGLPAPEFTARARSVHDLAGLGGVVRGSLEKTLPTPRPSHLAHGLPGLASSSSTQAKEFSSPSAEQLLGRSLLARATETRDVAIILLETGARRRPYAAIVRALVEYEQLGAARSLVSYALRETPADSYIEKIYKLLSPPLVNPVPETDNNRVSEYQWLISHATDYRGRWVAIEGEHLIAHAASLKDLLAIVRIAQPHRRPLIHRVE
jgi:hypothetical protein